MNFRNAIAATAASLVIAGCGGGGGGRTVGNVNDITHGVPQSALTSVTGLVVYLTQLIVNSSDTAEPVMLGDITLPVADTVEPATL